MVRVAVVGIVALRAELLLQRAERRRGIGLGIAEADALFARLAVTTVHLISQEIEGQRACHRPAQQVLLQGFKLSDAGRKMSEGQRGLLLCGIGCRLVAVECQAVIEAVVVLPILQPSVADSHLLCHRLRRFLPGVLPGLGHLVLVCRMATRHHHGYCHHHQKAFSLHSISN